MQRYLVLWNFTNDGIKNVNETISRAERFREIAESMKIEVREFLWTMGEYDGAVLLDAPDDNTLAKLLFRSGAGGNATTKTLKAFNKDEIKDILGI